MTATTDDRAPDGAPTRAAGGAERQLTEQGRERKQRLVDAAAELFAERGYAATRIADICDAAGAAKGLFYWYFPTKQDLFGELVRTMRRRLRRAQADAMDPTADPVTRIRQGAEASVRFICDHASYFAFVQDDTGHPDLTTTSGSGHDVYLTDVVQLVEAACAVDATVTADPVLTALGVVGAVRTYTEAWRTGRLEVTPEHLAAFVGDWVESALRADRPVAV